MLRRLPERRNRYDQPNEKRRPRRGDEGRDPGVQPREREQPRLGAERGAEKEIGGTIEGQSLAAPITLLDKLAEDCEELSGELYGLRNRLPLGERCEVTITWPSSK